MTSTTDSILMTSETWSDYQALELIEAQLGASLAHLNGDQRERYLKLCRIEPQARQDLAEAIQNFKRDFEETANTELVELFRQKTGQTLDLHDTWLHTRVLEMPQRENLKDPIELLSKLFSSRVKRALADDAPRERFMSTTLWQAAKDNFAFHLSSRLHSGLDFQRASVINTSAEGSLNHGIEHLQVTQCIDLIRQYDLASRLRIALASHVATTLDPLIFAHRKASFELDLLEALRSKKIPDDGIGLMAALTQPNALKWQFFHLYFGWQLLPTPTTVPLPFCVFSLPESAGVFSYFPNRPLGTLRHHRTSTDAITSLREQICADAKANRIDWLLRTLSLADQAVLLGELKTTTVNEDQLNWLAKQLYTAFNSRSPAAERIYIRAEINQPRPTTHSLLTAMERRQSLLVFQDLQSIATSTASKDWEQVKKALLHIGSEILELLTLPAPGGVTGLNRLMMIASLGSLTYNSITASEALARGQSAEFVQALGDIAELMISSRIQTVGARLSAQRTQHLIAAIGKPRAIEMHTGDRRLWLPDLRPYTELHSRLLDGLSATSQGLFDKDGKTYAQIKVDDQIRVGELAYDAELKHYRLKHPDAQQYQPIVRYDQSRNHWRLAPADVSHMTSTELLQTMLRPDRPSLSREDIHTLQALTQVSRQQLEAAWNGDAPIPWALEFATQELQQRRAQGQLEVMEPDPTTSALRQRFNDLPEAAARELVREYPALKNLARQAPLEPTQRAAVEKAQMQSRLIRVFNTLNDPKGRDMGPDAEAVACNLVTVQPGWPADLCIQVFQGASDFSGGIVKTTPLLGTYGNESAPHAVVLARLNDHYAGYDRQNQDMLQPHGPDYPLASALLRTLTDEQRNRLNYQLSDGSKLAAAILSAAHINSATLSDLLPQPMTFELGAKRLAAFQLAYDYSASNVDSDGLYTDGGRLYARIDGDFFQVLYDRDASSPGRKVMRIVRPGDPVASDPDNRYVASRAGRSEPITRNAQGLWVGAITGLIGGAPKSDRLKAMREKTLAERQQYISNELLLQQVLSEFEAHFNQPGSTTYFIVAGSDYYHLKQMTHENLYVQVLRHRKAATTDFEDLPPSIPLKREALIRSVIELENIELSYSRISDLYQGINALELQTMEDTGLSDLTAALKIPLYQPMKDANVNVVSLIERFKALVNDEIDRLLIKLDELPVAPEPQTRRTPSPGKGRSPSKTKHSVTPPPAAPKNRVDIVTQDNILLSGKPRSDNRNIVDILDSRGQRKTTYIRSSDGQYWVEHITTRPPSTNTDATATATPAWEPYEAAAQKLLKEAQRSESVADYLGRKKGSAPSAPEGLLEYHANRLEEHAKEIHDLTTQLTSAREVHQAQDNARELREKAQHLRQKGRTLRVDLIITNNAPVANDLQYLADSNNLSVRKTRHERIAMERAGSSRQRPPRDYIDEFELKIKDRNQVWAYAHLHYAELASDSAAFTAAHLKRPDQRFQGAQLQTQEAQAGRRYEIHRGALEKTQVLDILLSERFV